MNEWRECKLGNVCVKVLTGGTPLTKKTEYYLNGKIPWLRTKEVNFCKINNTENYISELGLANSAAKLVPANSVIVAMYGQGDTAGRVAINKIPLATNQACCNLVIDDGVADYQFIYYLLKNSYFELVQRKTGSAQPNLNTQMIKDFDISLPPLPEQRAIASILSSLDEKIDLLHRQNKTLEALAETLFRQWFVEEAEEGWGTKSLGDVCLKTASGGTPSTKVSDYYRGSINWYSTTELNDNFLFESVSKITKLGLENSSAKLFPENTIVIAIYAAPTVGRLGILGNEASFNQAACGFIADETKVCFEYLYLHLLLSRQKLNDMASGSAQQNLNVGIIKSFPIPLPPKDKMDEFRNQSRSLFQKIKSNSIQIRTLTRLRDTLLPKLMSGEVRVKLEEEEAGI